MEFRGIADYTDIYFTKSRKATEGSEIYVKYNVFIRSKESFVLSGIEETKMLIKAYHGKVTYSLNDGDVVNPKSGDPITILIYEGYFRNLVDIETCLLGNLSDACTSATEMSKIIKCANGKPVIYMGARHRSILSDDIWSLGAITGGAAGVTVKISSDKIGCKVFGSMPHALALVKGSTLEAAKALKKAYPDEPLSVLVDTFGREIDDTIEAVKYFNDELYSVRIDTHGGRVCQGCLGIPYVDNFNQMTDDVRIGLWNKIIKAETVNYYPELLPMMEKCIFGKGVTIESIFRLRKALDDNNGKHVKIIASSGFDWKKVKLFELFETPVDIYGCGLGNVEEYLFATSDIVEVNFLPIHKAGRYESQYEDGIFKPVIQEDI